MPAATPSWVAPRCFFGFVVEFGGKLFPVPFHGLIDVVVHDLRDYSSDKHRKVDDEPYGGGPGMVMTAQPWFAAVERIGEADRVILLSPQGRTLTQSVAKELAALAVENEVSES